MSSLFNLGERVEVRRTTATTSVWSSATIVRPEKTHRHKLCVEYEMLTSSEGVKLKEYVSVFDIRPAPPPELHRYFLVGDIVEAFCDEKKGWRKGEVVDILENSKYSLLLENGEEESGKLVEVEQWKLRFYRDWDDGSWVPPLNLDSETLAMKISSNSEVKPRGLRLRIKCSKNIAETKFCKGMLVEIKDNKAGFYVSWYAATIVAPLGEDKFLVVYRARKDADETEFLKDVVDISFIRPYPPDIQRIEPYECLEQVDAWYNDGWWTGYIARVMNKWKYVVSFTTSNVQMAVEHSKLRPHQEWKEGKWVAVSKVNLTRADSKPNHLKLKLRTSGKTEDFKFTKGMTLEVKCDEEGYQGSWYTARIVDCIGTNKLMVEYDTLKTDDESELLKEMVFASYVRPCPPEISAESFKLLEEVDAWYNEGWWVGLISKVLDGLKYAVYFWTTNEELIFEHCNLRPHQEWINGKRSLAYRKKPKFLMKSRVGKCKRKRGQVGLEANFSHGTKVEIKSEEEGYRGSWYPAVIVRAVGSERYLVEYQTLITDDETRLLKEVADAQCIRPLPPVIQRTDQFEPLEEVDAWYNDGWWIGLVLEAHKGSKYTVYFSTTNELLEFHHSDLRPHQEWTNGEWIITGRGHNSFSS